MFNNNLNLLIVSPLYLNKITSKNDRVHSHVKVWVRLCLYIYIFRLITYLLIKFESFNILNYINIKRSVKYYNFLIYFDDCFFKIYFQLRMSVHFHHFPNWIFGFYSCSDAKFLFILTLIGY
jgi:hypothetical protein